MDKLDLVNAVRKLVVNASGISGATDLKVFGMNFNPAGKRLWAEEFVNGGELSRASNSREQLSGFIMEYHFHVPAGRSAEDALDKVNDCLDAIHIDDRISVSGGDCFIERMKTEREEGKDWNTVKLILTVSATDAG